MDRSLGSTGNRNSKKSTMSGVRRVRAPLAAALALAALFAAVSAGAALYKWTDANGRVVYSDQPPAGDVKVETISGPPPPANPNAVREMVGKETEIKKQQSDSAENAKKTAQARTDSEKLANSCRDWRAEITRLAANQIILFRINEKGEQVLMDDAERRKRRETLEGYVKTNCPRG
jgi:Skp family chaperone for outer membrane proteins